MSVYFVSALLEQIDQYKDTFKDQK